MKWYVCLNILFSLILVSCVEQASEEAGNIEIKNDGIFVPVSMTYEGEEVKSLFDLGEYVTGSGKDRIILKIKNNTNFPMIDMEASFPDQTSKRFAFYSSVEDDGGYPGVGGSCGTVLEANQSCEIHLSVNIVKSGNYEERFVFNFKNLVEKDGKQFKFSVVAGQPASLIFDDGSTNSFFFGEKVTSAKKPILERAEELTYEKVIQISNQGELNARDVVISDTFACSSESAPDDFAGDIANYAPAGFTPINFCEAWTVTHNCPSVLTPQQSCTVKSSYSPLNQDQSGWGFREPLEEIYYQSSIRASYKSTPDGQLAALSGNLKNYSTSIRAKMESTKDSINFSGSDGTIETIVGNRQDEFFKIKNQGYRDGELLGFLFTKQSDSTTGQDRVVCKKAIESDVQLTCYNADDESVIMTLADFPFFINSRDNCIGDASTSKNLPIEQGCGYDIIFQPSISYTTRHEFFYKANVLYDSRWKGVEDRRDEFIFDLRAKSLHAGRIELSSVALQGGATYTASGANTFSGAVSADNLNQTVDFGRLALLLKGERSWRSISLTFTNTGGASISAKDVITGVANNFVGELSVPIGSESGTHGNYFDKLKIDNCGNSSGEILGDPSGANPLSKCVLSLQFSPVLIESDDEAAEGTHDQNMFDIVTAANSSGTFENSNATGKYKVFSFQYHDRSNFSDSNTSSETGDITSSSRLNWKEYNVGLTTQLIQKGFLKNYGTEAFNFRQYARGRTGEHILEFKNIGTGTISWIPYIGDRIDPYGRNGQVLDDGMTIVSLSESEKTANGGMKDCRDVFDFGYDPAVNESYSSASSRINGLEKLGSGETCGLKIVFEEADSRLISNSANYGNTIDTGNSELGRFVRVSDQDGLRYALNILEGVTLKNVIVNFYDGDADGQVNGDEFEQSLGEFFENGNSHLIGSYQLRGSFQNFAKLFISNPEPFMSSIVIRPEYSTPSIGTIPGAAIASGIYTTNNIKAILSNGVDNTDCIDFLSCLSHNYTGINRGLGVTSSLDASIDYVIHAGSFPSNVTSKISFFVGNASTLPASNLSAETISNLTLNGSSSSLSGVFLKTSNIAAADIRASTISASTISSAERVNIDFSPGNNTGEFSAVYELSYDTGAVSPAPSRDTLRVKIIAESIQHEGIEVEVEDYLNNSLVGSRSPASLGYNHDDSTTKIEFESIQLKVRSNSSPSVKKRVYIKNSSTTDSIYNVSLYIKDSPIAPVESNTYVKSNTLLNRQVRIEESSCNNFMTGTAIGDLSPSSECYIDFWFQPIESDMTANTYLVMTYDTGNNRNQFIQQNLAISFIPQPPSVVLVENQSQENIQYRDRDDGNTLKSGQKAYNLNVGNLTYNQLNQEFESEVTLINENNITRASLLRQYEIHNNISQPSNLDSSDITFNNDGFVEIYNLGASRVLANSICLFGGVNESSNSVENKGFNFSTDTDEDCELKIYFRPGVNSIGRKIVFSDVDTTSDYYFKLAYYNNKRDSVSEIYFTYSGRIYPPSSTRSSSGDFTNVQALAGSSISFDWVSLNSSNADLGSVVGYRVYYSRFNNLFDNLYTLKDSNAEYRDFYNLTNNITLNDSYINDLTTYYIKVYAIIENANYTQGEFNGLNTGHFLSDGGLPLLTVTVPSSNYIYDHTNTALIARYKDDTPTDYPGAIDHCADKRGLSISVNGLSRDYSYELIKQESWNLIEQDFTYSSSYSDVRSVPHWIQTGYVFDIDTIFSSVSGYQSTDTYQQFIGGPFSEDTAYLRSTDDIATEFGTTNVVKTEGGYIGNSDMEVYMTPGLAQAFPRCSVEL